MRIDLPLCSFKDCRHNFDGNCRSKERKEKCEFDVYKKAVENQPKIGVWIPCSERLPDTRNNVLICQNDGYVSIGYYSQEKFLDLNSYPFNEVIAWQPLPEEYHGQ